MKPRQQRPQWMPRARPCFQAVPQALRVAGGAGGGGVAALELADFPGGELGGAGGG